MKRPDRQLGDPVHAIVGDGRARRSERTRRNIITAYLFLVRQTLREPSMKQIAKMAKCSLRSVYERMTDIHTLQLAVLDHVVGEGSRSALVLPADLDQDARLRAIVRFQAEKYEKWGPLWHLAIRYHDYADIRFRLERFRSDILENRIGESCVVELAGCSETDRRNWLKLIEATTSLENWQFLRYHKRLPFDDICEQWTKLASHTIGASSIDVPASRFFMAPN
jgi:AcrR family transcriptional regulator